jgi:hypothetical protein
MRKIFAPLILAGTLTLGACATSPYGGMGGPLESVLGSVLGGAVNGGYGNGGYGNGSYGNGSYGGYGNSGYGYNNGGNFQQAAVNACGSQASRYGQVQIRDIRQQSSSTLRVYGDVYSNYGRRDFQCSFRSDGRITDFDL